MGKWVGVERGERVERERRVRWGFWLMRKIHVEAGF